MKNLDLTKIIRKDILKMATYKPAPYLLDIEEGIGFILICGFYQQISCL